MDTILCSQKRLVTELQIKQNSVGAAENSFLAREIGHNSYKRTPRTLTFPSGYEYWEKTNLY